MHFRRSILSGIAVLAVTALPVHAADDTPGFNELDRDGDGSISRAEAAAHPGFAARFNALDDDADGTLTRYEYVKAAAAEDLRNLRERAAEFIQPDNEDDRATTGASQPKAR